MNALEIQTERVDDIPLLMAQQQKMGIVKIIDEVIKSHGNRRGLSVGEMVQVWLSYILSEGDHRMVVVEDWISSRLTLLGDLIGKPVSPKDFTDDRLANILEVLDDDETWASIETKLGEHMIQVYRLSDTEDTVIRLDSTSVSGHHQITEDGLFQYGYSKDYRPDLAQYKVMLATLDPMGMPMASLIVSGEKSDDGLYIPAIQRSQRIVGKGNHLYVGDSKLSARDNRGYIAQSGDYYLTVLPRRHQGNDEISQWLQPVFGGKQGITAVKISKNERKGEVLWALGYETTRQQQAEVEGKSYHWQERVAVVFRPSQAKQERHFLVKRLQSAEKALQQLVSKRWQRDPRWKSLAVLEAAAQGIVKKHRVDGFLDIDCQRHEEDRSVRGYGDRPTRTETWIRYTMTIQRNGQAIREARQKLGWRLYVTNAPPEQLSFQKVVTTYRDAPRIELDFRRLKGHPLGVRPVYIHRDDHTVGLSRLLMLALRVLTLTEFVVREKLQQQQEELLGLYPGQPKRATNQPTTERLLRAFKGIDLSLVKLGGQLLRHITHLSPLQHQILELLGLSEAIYDDLASSEPQFPP